MSSNYHQKELERTRQWKKDNQERVSAYGKDYYANLDPATKKKYNEARAAKRKAESAPKYLSPTVLAVYQSGLLEGGGGDEAPDPASFSNAARAVCHAYVKNPIRHATENADGLSSAELKKLTTKADTAREKLRGAAKRAAGVGEVGAELLRWPKKTGKTYTCFSEIEYTQQLAFANWFLGLDLDKQDLFPFWRDVCDEFGTLEMKNMPDVGGSSGGGGHGEVVADPGLAPWTDVPEWIDPSLLVVQPPAHDPKGKGKAKDEGPALYHHHHLHHHHSERQHHQDTGRAGPSSSSSSTSIRPTTEAIHYIAGETPLGYYKADKVWVPFYKSEAHGYIWLDATTKDPKTGQPPAKRKCKFVFNDNDSRHVSGYAVDRRKEAEPYPDNLSPFFCRKSGKKETEAFYFDKMGRTYRYLEGMDRTVREVKAESGKSP